MTVSVSTALLFQLAFGLRTPSRSRGALRPSFALVVAAFLKGRREGRAPAGTRDPLCDQMHAIRCATKCTRKCTTESRWAGPTRPSLREWFDGWRALPGADLPSGLPRLANQRRTGPGWAQMHRPQGLTVATTARTARFGRTRSASLVQRGLRAAYGGRLNPLPALRTHPRRRCPRLPHPDPRFVTTYDRPFRGSGRNTSITIPNSCKAKLYFGRNFHVRPTEPNQVCLTSLI